MNTPAAEKHRKLGIFSLAVLLVSAQYGSGFLLGTAEAAFDVGLAGSLYPLSIGVGAALILLLAGFYWHEIEQIWTLLGDRYGHQSKAIIAFMSWISIIGIEAAQVLAGAFILKVLNVPVNPAMVVLTGLFLVLSLLPTEKVSWVFRALLFLNLGALIYSLWALHCVGDYVRSPLDFVPAFQSLDPATAIGVGLSTVIFVMMDMKYQQYVVQAKDTRSLYWGCTLGALALMAMAFLPSVVVVAAQHSGILPAEVGGKESISYILAWVGGGPTQPVGIALIAALVVPALGSGSTILRVQTKTILDFGWFEANAWTVGLVASVNALIGLAIALKGGAIIGLIVTFPAAYVGAALVPFVAYWLAQTQRYEFSAIAVQLALGVGSLVSVMVLCVSLIWPDWLVGNAALDIMVAGIVFGSLVLIGSEVVVQWPRPTDSGTQKSPEA
ncbi:MAG: hypothetical protein AB4042_18725 [Leptolyngbyaceae cyanobacterium]